jgi:hypothetical protein
MELSIMRLSLKYTWAPYKFWQTSQEKYQYLEDMKQSDHEKIGQLSACAGDYADFASVMKQKTRTAKQL